MKGYQVQYEQYNPATKRTETCTEYAPSYAEALDLKDTLEAEGAVEVSVEAAAIVRCCQCQEWTDAVTVHLHQGQWIGDECWDERLRASE